MAITFSSRVFSIESYSLLVHIFVLNVLSKIMFRYIFATINGFYYLATVNAMLAFRLSSTRPWKAELCTTRTLYCYVFSTLMAMLLPSSQMKILLNIKRPQEKFVGTFVFLLQIVLSAVTTVFMFYFQVIQRHGYVRIINKIVTLNELIKTQTAEKTTFFDPCCQKLYWTRIAVALVQVSVLMVSLIGFIGQLAGDSWLIPTLFFIFVLYTHTVHIIFSLIFIGSMMVMLQLYRDVNGKIEQLIDVVLTVQGSDIGGHGRMQRYCDLSDGLDVMAQLYERVTDISLDMMRFFGIHLLLDLLNAFTNILFTVL